MKFSYKIALTLLAFSFKSFAVCSSYSAINQPGGPRIPVNIGAYVLEGVVSSYEIQAPTIPTTAPYNIYGGISLQFDEVYVPSLNKSFQCVYLAYGPNIYSLDKSIALTSLTTFTDSAMKTILTSQTSDKKIQLSFRVLEKGLIPGNWMKLLK